MVIAGCGDDGHSSSMMDAAMPVDAIDATVIAVDCPTYCDHMQSNCTGDNQQYADRDHCLAACKTFNASGQVVDTTGNTLGCRLHFAIEARTSAVDSCVSASVTGGPVMSPGPCSGGDVCKAFCALDIMACGSTDMPLPGNPRDSTNNPLYQYTPSGCVTVCHKYDLTHAYSLTAKGDSLACRIYEAIDAAVAVTPNAVNACPETGDTPAARCAGAASP